MPLKQVEGIILQSLPLRERTQILTLFTKEQGLLKLVTPSKSSSTPLLFSPLSRGSFLYLPHSRGGDLHKYREGRLLDAHLPLRQNLSTLQSAGSMAQSLHSSQMPEKQAPLLYQLFCLYLRYLPQVQDPTVLECSFFLKLLKHEGLLPFSGQCIQCKTPLKNSSFSKEGAFCDEHSPESEAVFFDEEETLMLFYLASIRKMDSLLPLQIPESFHHSIQQLVNIVMYN